MKKLILSLLFTGVFLTTSVNLVAGKPSSNWAAPKDFTACQRHCVPFKKEACSKPSMEPGGAQWCHEACSKSFFPQKHRILKAIEACDPMMVSSKEKGSLPEEREKVSNEIQSFQPEKSLALPSFQNSPKMNASGLPAPVEEAFNDLGLTEGPYTLDKANTAYRKLALKYHPDRNKGAEKETEGKFKEITNSIEKIRNFFSQ